MRTWRSRRTGGFIGAGSSRRTGRFMRTGSSRRTGYFMEAVGEAEEQDVSWGQLE